MADKLEIPHLLHVFSTFAVGGPQTRFVTLANRLGAKYRHRIFALDGNLACAARLDPAVDARAEAVRLTKGGSLSLGNLRTIRRLLAETRPDAVLTYNWGAIEWVLAERILPVVRRHIHFEDGFGPDEGPSRQLPRRVLFRRLALGGNAQIVVPSRTLQRVATEIWRLDPRSVRYIPNGIDFDRFSAPPDPALADRLGRDADTLIIGTLGILRPEKNLQRLLRAFAALPDYVPSRLVIVGSGPEAPALAALARSLNIADRVVLFGQIDRPERILGHFDIFAMSSDTEQMPVSLLEAMAAGLPVAATDVGDIAEIVAPANRRFIVPVAEEARLAQAFAELLADPALRREIGRANRDRVRLDFSFDGMVASYDALFSSAIGAPPIRCRQPWKPPR
jgi:L-malate glycosyltransferase